MAIQITKKSTVYLALIIGTSILTGCAPIVSGAMNATLTDETILEKTGSHFGAPLSKITISDKQNDVISTTYKTHYAGKVYNCSIYYGTVKCDLLGSAQDFGIATKNNNPLYAQRKKRSR